VTVRSRALRIAGAVVLAVGAALALAAPAHAEYVNDATVEITVNADTTIDIVETFEYDFEYESRHGIYRDIPLYDETALGERRIYDVTLTSVTMDGRPVPVELTENGPYLNVRIGDPVSTVTGRHVYRIEYTVTDGLRVITADDVDDPAMPAGISAGDIELYYDLVGPDWSVAFQSASGTITGPGAVISAICYAGGFGGTTRCAATTDGPTAQIGPTPLDAGQALTAVVVFPAAAFTQPVTENIRQGLPSSPLLGGLLGLVPAVLLIALPAAYAVSRRREDRGVDLEGAPPQYAPPDGLTAAELAAAWQGDEVTERPTTMIATLVDLAARRWIDLSDTGGLVTVTWKGTGVDPIRPWEESLVGAILKGQPTAALSGYDEGLSALWGSTSAELTAAAEATGRRNPEGDEPDRRWRWLAWTFLGLLVVGFGAAIIGEPFLAALAFVVAMGAVIGYVVSRAITPRKETMASAQFQAKVRGLSAVLGTDSAAARREFAQRTGLAPAAILATMLPFAIVLGLRESWVAAFPDLSPEQLASVGFGYIAIGSLDGIISSGTGAASAAMTAPSSGSGGGGFSGGGIGGGGGGSW
jgi:hypothetical protein